MLLKIMGAYGHNAPHNILNGNLFQKLTAG